MTKMIAPPRIHPRLTLDSLLASSLLLKRLRAILASGCQPLGGISIARRSCTKDGVFVHVFVYLAQDARTVEASSVASLLSQ